jgi:hypothetical protein
MSMWRYFCDLPVFVLTYFNQADRCALPWGRDNPPSTVVLLWIASAIVFPAFFVLAIRSTLYTDTDERARNLWWCAAGAALLTLLMTKALASLL